MQTQPVLTSSTACFRYQPDKIKTGAVYHYRKSNLDGTLPADVSIYVPSRSHIEVLKVEHHHPVYTWVTADIDWELFSATHLQSWFIYPTQEFMDVRLYPPGILAGQAFGRYSDEENTFRMWFQNMQGSASVGHLPFHIYNFDFISFNFVFRHLVDPQAPFEIGILDPDWDVVARLSEGKPTQQQNIFGYRGKAHIDYVCDEVCHQKPCRKYRIGGPGMADQEGFFWVDQEREVFENFEHPLHDNVEWTSFKFELLSSEFMSEGEWIEFLTMPRTMDLP